MCGNDVWMVRRREPDLGGGRERGRGEGEKGGGSGRDGVVEERKGDGEEKG